MVHGARGPRQMALSEVVFALLTLCQILLPTAASTAAGFLPSETAQKFLTMHNLLRESVLPPAANMNLLTWSYTLQVMAAVRSSECNTESITMSHLEHHGPHQNVYIGYSSDPSQIVALWFAQGDDIPASSSTDYCHADRGCPPYANIVTARLDKIGCSIGRCPKHGFSAVCLYAHDFSEFPMYKPGPSCSECSPDKPFCLFNLCTSRIVASSNETRAAYPNAVNYLISHHSNASRATCDPCSPKPVCLNGGNSTGSPLCGCNCSAGFFGKLCEFHTSRLENSAGINLTFQAGPRPQMKWPPSSQVHTKLWPHVQATIAELLTTFCNASKRNAAKCCERNSSDVANVTGEIGIDQVSLNRISWHNRSGLQLNYSVIAARSTLCLNSFVSPASNSTPPYLPANYLISHPNMGSNAFKRIQRAVTGCCVSFQLNASTDFSQGPHFNRYLAPGLNRVGKSSNRHDAFITGYPLLSSALPALWQILTQHL